MTAIGNFFRFILFGWWQWLIYMFFAFIFGLTIVFLPLAKSFREMAKLILRPYGKRIIKDKKLLGKYENGFGLFFNIIWFPIGLVFFIFYFIKGFFEMITIVGIPFAIVDFRIGRAMFLPIGIRILNEDDYISYKVGKEIQIQEQINEPLIKTKNITGKSIKKKKLTKKEIKELEEQEKELELLRKKQELENLKRKEEFNKKIVNIKDNIKIFSKNTYNKSIDIFKKYLPIFISKSKKIEKQLLKKGKIITKEFNSKMKNIDTENLKTIGLNNIDKIKSIKVNNKYKKYFILIIILLILGFIGNYIYNNFYYSNQIIKIGNKISFKKSIDSIEYFDNNKIKIVPDNLNNPILSQYLMGYREYDNGYNYKKAGYSAIYLKKDDVFNLESVTYDLEGKDIIVDSKKKDNNTLIINYNEKINRINLYDTELFKELNAFTNINTFYSNISNRIDFVSDSNLILKIYGNFDVGTIIDKIDSFVRTEQLKSKLVGLDIKDKKLILRIKYNFYNDSKDNFNFLFESIDQLDDEIPEESILTYENSKIENNGNYVNIKIEFLIEKDDIDKDIFTNLY